MTADGPAEPEVNEFPRAFVLELLRNARHLLSGTERQLALLEDLRIPAHLVLGRRAESPPVTSPAAGSHRSAITAPGLRHDAPTEQSESRPGAEGEPTAGELPIPDADRAPSDYLEARQPVPGSSVAPEAAPVEDIAASAPAERFALPARRFAEGLVDIVCEPDHLDASVILVRRAQSELPEEQRAGWGWLIDELERQRLEIRRLELAEGSSPDLATLTDWVGFECLHHYSLTDRFFGREEYIAELDAWVADKGSDSVLCLTALGGAGKSALAWRWLNGALTHLRQEGYRGALWCSFYEGTFKFEDFLRRALAFCGRAQSDTEASGGDGAPLVAKSREQVESQLLELLAREHYVLVIDGLERLMTGYAQTAERAVDDEGTRGASDRDEATREERLMEDRRDGEFLSRLAAPLSSRVLLTTRLRPADLETSEDGAMPHVRNVQLPGLDRRDAEALWTSIVPGSQIDEDVWDVLEACGYHPLATSILARSVAAGGEDFAAWRRQESHRDFSPSGSTARVRAHVIEICRRDLGFEAEDVLNLLAVSGKPMRIGELEAALREHSIANGEELWTVPGRVHQELRRLMELGFVGEAVVDGNAEYDLHPVVRGVVWRAMTDPRSRSRVLDQALTELTAVPDPQLPMGQVEVQKAASFFKVLVAGGQWDRAWEMLRYKLWVPLYAQGAYPELLDLFEQLLPGHDPLQLLPLRSRREQAEATDLLADLMMITGEGAVADRLMVWCGAIRLRINDAVGFLEVRRRQTWQCLYEGRLYDTEMGLRQVKVQAAAMGVGRLFSTVDPWIGLTLALRGLQDDARRYLVVDEADEENRRWWLQGAAEGYVYLGEHARAVELLDQLPHDDDGVDPLQRAWELLTRGMASVGLGVLDQAEQHLLEALSIARRAGYRIIECFAIVALAEVDVARSRWVEVEEWLRQYFAVDEAGAYRLTAGDAWRLRALCAEQRGAGDVARGLAATAYQACVCDGPPFMHAAAARRARELLTRLRGYVPRTSSRLPPEWRTDLQEVISQEEELAGRARTGFRRILIEQGPSRELRWRMRRLVDDASDEDRRWWTLVAGTDPTLTEALAAAMVSLEVSVAELRGLFEKSTEKSLEVIFFRLRATRVLQPDRPTSVSSLSPEGRSEWLTRLPDHEAALDEFLRSERALNTEEPFRRQGLDARGVEAFSRDGRRRILVEQASADARRWWAQLAERRDPWHMLILAECIQSAGATLDEYFEAISITGRRGLEYGFLSRREKSAIARLKVTVASRTDGWPAYEVRLRLQTVKYQLGWFELSDQVRAFWTGIEERNAQHPEFVLQLAEELAMRGSSIAEYHEASLRSSDPEDPRATLAYLDYLRLSAAPWADGTWPDDVSVQRWSYDAASPTFRDVSSWTPAQVTRRLEMMRDRIYYGAAAAKAREWWDHLEAIASGPTMIRLSEELDARAATVEEFYRAHVDAATDNILAVLAYLDFSRVARRALSSDESHQAWELIRAGEAHYSAKEYAEAAEAYTAAIAADPRAATAHLHLALSLEQLAADDAGGQRAMEALRRGIEACGTNDRPQLDLELRRLRLGLAPFRPAEERAVSVELSEPLVADVDALMGRVDTMRAEVRTVIGVAFSGLVFRLNEALPPGAYRILFDDVTVAEGRTVPGGLFHPTRRVAEPDLWLSTTEPPPGEWRDADPPTPATAMTPHDYLLAHLRLVMADLTPQLLTEETVLGIIEEGWSVTPLDPAADLPLLVAFTDVLRNLLDDRVPVPEPDVLLDAFRPLHEAGLAPAQAIDTLRMLPDVRRRLPGNREQDVVVRLPPSVEQAVAENVVFHEASLTMLVSATVMHEVLTETRSLLAPESDPESRPVLEVRTTGTRRALRCLLRFEFPGLPVVAEEELLPKVAP